MLRVERLHAGYDTATVLHSISLRARRGAVHAVIGPNGAGKSTLLGAVAGLVPARRGLVMLDRRDITTVPVHRRSRAGIALVPQGRRVFASLTVGEHLAIAARRPGRHGDAGQSWDRERVLALLPQLSRRLRHRGAQLSGGEQQMLAIARALLTQPRLLLLDEPTEGLAPILADQILELLAGLARDGLTVLLAATQPALAAVADDTTTLIAGHIAAEPSGVAPRHR